MSEQPQVDGIESYLEEGFLTHAGWSRALRDGVLLGQRCEDCGHLTAAPKAACAQCGSEAIAPIRLPTTGEVYSETTVQVAPEQFEGPYQVALVTLGDARVMARVEDGVEIGDTVHLGGVVEEDAYPGPLFRPAD